MVKENNNKRVPFRANEFFTRRNRFDLHEHISADWLSSLPKPPLDATRKQGAATRARPPEDGVEPFHWPTTTSLPTERQWRTGIRIEAPPPPDRRPATHGPQRRTSGRQWPVPVHTSASSVRGVRVPCAVPCSSTTSTSTASAVQQTNQPIDEPRRQVVEPADRTLSKPKMSAPVLWSLGRAVLLRLWITHSS